MMPALGNGILARLAIAAAIAVVAASAGAQENDPFAAQRQLFVLAYTAAEAGLPLTDDADPPALRAYPLYPYLERARLMQALAKERRAADEAARNFLWAHRGKPVTRELRRALLQSLADRGDWATFTAEYDPAVADARLRCELLNARIALGETTGLQAAVVEQWLTPQRLPPPCESAFDWLRAQNGLSPALVEQRVRLLLDQGEFGFARTIARSLPAAQAAPLLHWATLLEKPAAGIDAAIANPKTAELVAGAPLLAGWRKLTRSDPDAARARYAALVRRLRDVHEDPSRHALALALGFAWDRRAAEALELFRDVDPEDLDDVALGWQARAAMWAGDWREVQRSIAAMSDRERGHARWRYWSARAAAERGDEESARALYHALLPSDNYYAANAAARLGLPSQPHPAALAGDAEQVAALGERPGFVRARELLLCGLRSAALTEWLVEFGQLDDAQRTQAVLLSSSWDWHDVAVAMATRQNVFFDYALLYPRPFDGEVGAAAKLADLDERLIYGVIRQESLFRADAVSSAGAMGLAQLMPETARRTARAWGHPAPSTTDLLDPATNVKIGAWHIRELLDQFQRQAPVALAGYNAGPAAARRWLPNEPIDADVWIENIPYNETREYVQRVLWHSVVFGWLKAGAPQDVAGWIMKVVPLQADSTTEAG
jgi:soluble lytic murein transglycosylase